MKVNVGKSNVTRCDTSEEVELLILGLNGGEIEKVKEFRYFLSLCE